MKKLLLTAGTLALLGFAGHAEAYNGCRDFTRETWRYGRHFVQSGTECLRNDGVWEIVSANEDYYPTTAYYYQAPEVRYVERRPVYAPNYVISLGYFDKGPKRHYDRRDNRNWHDHGRRGHH